MDWYVLALRKYAQFGGRSRRREYWMYSLVNGMVWLLLYGGGILTSDRGSVSAFLLLLSITYALGTAIPSLACGVRRLHDTGRTGWWMLMGFVPILGLVLLGLLAIDSEPGGNEYGPNPKLGAPDVLIG